jgi:hypothetical protein
MKSVLVRLKSEIYHIVNDKKIYGVHSGIHGNVTGIWGNVTGIRGDVSGIRGDVSGIRGDVDDAELSDEERKKGVDINDLIKGASNA